MKKAAFYWINAITLYRVTASLLLLYLAVSGQEAVFKWVLGVSFFTDAIDGLLARSFRVSSSQGARLDSIGDDLTVLMGIIGMITLKPGFLVEKIPETVALLLLFVVQATMAYRKYGRFSSFHTRLAKLAALLQGSFLILFFFLPEPPTFLFYVAVVVTALDLLEEMILVVRIPVWKTDVKGLLWMDRNKRTKGKHRHSE